MFFVHFLKTKLFFSFLQDFFHSLHKNIFFPYCFSALQGLSRKSKPAKGVTLPGRSKQSFFYFFAKRFIKKSVKAASSCSCET